MKWMATLLFTGVLPAAPQWLNYHDSRTPTKDGTPDLTAPAPRANGKPDLSGVWQAERTPVSELNRVLGDTYAQQQVDFNDLNQYVLDLFWGMKPTGEPITPAAAAIMKERANATAPISRCLPSGIPMSLFVYSFGSERESDRHQAGVDLRKGLDPIDWRIETRRLEQDSGLAGLYRVPAGN